MTKEVRVLTGSHAGARLKLTHGLWQISSNAEADIQISDWDNGPMQLDVRADEGVWLGPGSGSASRSMATQIFDLQPVRLGDIVLCVGRSDAQWPSDMALMQQLLTPAPAAEVAPVKRRFGSKALGVGAFALTIVGVAGITMLAVSGAPTEAAVMQPRPQTGPEKELARMQAMLGKLQQPELHAAIQNNHLLVSGMVKTAADAQAVTSTLGQTWDPPLDTRFSVAERMVDDIRSSLGERDVAVIYLGQGAFKVSGKAHDLDKARANLVRARNDYGGVITRFVDEMQAAPPSAPQNVNSMLNASDVQYVELQDGTKDFSNATP